MLTDTYPDSAYAHDATMLTMGSLSKAPSRIYSTSQREFAAKLWEELFRTTPERVVTVRILEWVILYYVVVVQVKSKNIWMWL